MQPMWAGVTPAVGLLQPLGIWLSAGGQAHPRNRSDWGSEVGGADLLPPLTVSLHRTVAAVKLPAL